MPAMRGWGSRSSFTTMAPRSAARAPAGPARTESQALGCVPSARYAEVVEKLRPGAAEPGDMVHVDGGVLGRHGGLLHYPVGQRRGIGISESQVDGEPLYVVRIEPRHRRLVGGPKAALGVAAIRLGTVDWLGLGAPNGQGA